MNTPKVCPFCDADTAAPKLIDTTPEEGGFAVCVVCSTCGARGPQVYETDMDSNSPMEKWNNRPVEDRLSYMVLETERRFKR